MNTETSVVPNVTTFPTVPYPSEVKLAAAIQELRSLYSDIKQNNVAVWGLKPQVHRFWYESLDAIINRMSC